MKQAILPVPEIALIAATRGMAGAGAALLIADRFGSAQRKAIGWPLFIIGVLSTVPILVDVIRKI